MMAPIPPATISLTIVGVESVGRQTGEGGSGEVGREVNVPNFP